MRWSIKERSARGQVHSHGEAVMRTERESSHTRSHSHNTRTLEPNLSSLKTCDLPCSNCLLWRGDGDSNYREETDNLIQRWRPSHVACLPLHQSSNDEKPDRTFKGTWIYNRSSSASSYLCRTKAAGAQPQMTAGHLVNPLVTGMGNTRSLTRVRTRTQHVPTLYCSG